MVPAGEEELLWRVGLFEEMGFEPGQELVTRNGEKRLRRVTSVRSAQTPEVWREGFPKPWNEVMEAAIR